MKKFLLILVLILALSPAVSAHTHTLSDTAISAKYHIDLNGNVTVIETDPPKRNTSVVESKGAAKSTNESNDTALHVFLIISFVVAFFVGGHVYRKYGAMLGLWKRCVFPLSLVAEPYIYAYRFQESMKPVCKKYRRRIIISFAISFLLFSPLVGIGFAVGYIFWFFLWRSKLGITQENCVIAARTFDDFVKPGMEDELSEAIATFYVQKLTGIKFKF